MHGKRNVEGKAEAIRLRTESRMSFGEIGDVLGVAKGTLWSWLKDYPLTKEEQTTRKKVQIAKSVRATVKDRGQMSKWWAAVNVGQMQRWQKAQIAEAAVLFRLTLYGFRTFSAVFDGDKTDWLVYSPVGVLKRIQVKWTKRPNRGMPHVSLLCSSGFKTYRRYRDDEYDAIIGYDLFTDTAYVFTPADLTRNKSTIAITPAHAEQWNKLM